MNYFDTDIQIYTFNSIKIYISPSPTIQSIHFFIDYISREGINHVFDMCNSKENKICYILKSNTNFHRIRIEDGLYPNEKQLNKLNKIFNKIDMDVDTKILLYCRAGLGRAPTVLAYIMISRFDYDNVDAVQEIRYNKKGSINAKQLEWVLNIKKQKGHCNVL